MKTKLIKGLKWFAFRAVLALGFVGVGLIYATLSVSNSVSVEVPAPKVIDLTPQKLEAMKDSVVDRLFDCENANYGEKDGILIFDTNNKASIGEGQMQKDFVKYYAKSLYGQDLSGKEAILLALDTPKAKAFAKDVIFKTDKGLVNWLNCANKLNLSGEVLAIKKLEKI